MKRILIFIILSIFIGCGSNNNSVNSTNVDGEHTKSVDGETYLSHGGETNGTIPQENNGTEVNNSVKDNGNGLGSATNILAYLTSENYESAQINHNSKGDILNYIKHSSDYSISPILQKLNIDKASVEIFYESNKSVKIPKKEIYVLSKNGDDSEIFLTFDGDKEYNQIENYLALIFYHNSLKIPTGFTNIDVNSTTKESLLKEIEGAFKQVGINNPEVVDGEKIKYETIDKNDGKVFQCKMGDNPEAITVTLDSDGSFSLSKYKSKLASISLKTKILCALEDTNSSLEVISIFKKMQSDISTILSSISTPIATPTPTPTPIPTVQATPTPQSTSTPSTTSGVMSPTPIPTSTPTRTSISENKYVDLRVGYKNNSQAYELNVTTYIKLKDKNIEPNNIQIQLFLENENNLFKSEPQIGVGTKYFYIGNIVAPEYYYMRYEYYFEVLNLTNNDKSRIEFDSLVKIYGRTPN